MKRSFEIANENGNTTRVVAVSAHQHIWNEITLSVSDNVRERVREELGNGRLVTQTPRGYSARVTLGPCQNPGCGQ